jgi:hypothetical protein
MWIEKNRKSFERRFESCQWQSPTIARFKEQRLSSCAANCLGIQRRAHGFKRMPPSRSKLEGMKCLILKMVYMSSGLHWLFQTGCWNIIPRVPMVMGALSCLQPIGIPYIVYGFWKSSTHLELLLEGGHRTLC